MKPSLSIRLAKKFTDCIVGIVGSSAFILTYPIITCLILLESKGPALYSQQRVGLNRRVRSDTLFSHDEESQIEGGNGGRRRQDFGGRLFTIYKYRTMRIDAEVNGPQLCAKGFDPRVTRVGKWLRALHLDELPQFWNILKGEMSFIGPRPERPHFTVEYGRTLPHYSDRTLHIKPGLTGLAQIVLGYDDSMESVIRKSHYDLSYRASFCSFTSWLKMEWWVFIHTFAYLGKKPQFEGETRNLAGLKRAKLLPFQGLAPGKANLRPATAHLSFEGAIRPLIIQGQGLEEIGRQLERLAESGKKSLEVHVKPDPSLDLEDLGYLVGLAHIVKQFGGRLCINGADPKIRKMLREIHLDKVVDLNRTPKSIRNFLTIDVECWFHAYHMKDKAPRCSWHRQSTHILSNMHRILELLRVHGVKATFFVLGWVADHFPEVVRMIDADGHEIGTHGYNHNLITDMTPEAFEDDLVKSLNVLSKHTSQEIICHRASNFTVVKSTLWALEILAKYGIKYDSSIFPVSRGRYGIPDYPNRLPHTLVLENGAEIREIPMSTARMLKGVFPIAGGGYLRLFPSWLTEKYVDLMNKRGLPAMVYLHPWELDAQQERHYLGAWRTFQHYVNTNSTEWKINRMLQRFNFGSVRENVELPRIQGLFRRNPVQVVNIDMDTNKPVRDRYTTISHHGGDSTAPNLGAPGALGERKVG